MALKSPMSLNGVNEIKRSFIMCCDEMFVQQGMEEEMVGE